LANYKWSKIKSAFEQNFCDELKGRVNIYFTRYRAQHEPESRFWVTVDGKEIITVSYMKWVIEYYGLADKIRETNNCTDFRDEKQKRGYYQAYDEAERILKAKGMLPDYEVADSLKAYPSMPFEEALNSNSPVIKALAMIDKRLGKRRLQEIRLSEKEHPLVKELYQLRCGVMNIK
jgi:hypothetical protein